MPIRDLHLHILRRTKRLRRQCKENPATAITNANSLVETTCKHILESRGKSCPTNLPKLASATIECLEKWITEGAPKRVVADIASNCAEIIVKTGALRDATGDAHGESFKQPRVPTPSDALFVVHLASATVFYLESLWALTYEEKTCVDLLPGEKDKLATIVSSYRHNGTITGYDKLPYSRELEKIQADFLRETGIRPKLPELWRAILNLRKQGKLSSKKSPSDTDEQG